MATGTAVYEVRIMVTDVGSAASCCSVDVDTPETIETDVESVSTGVVQDLECCAEIAEDVVAIASAIGGSVDLDSQEFVQLDVEVIHE